MLKNEQLIDCKLFDNITKSPKAGKCSTCAAAGEKKKFENMDRQWCYINSCTRLEASSMCCGVIANLWVRDEECGMEKGVCCGFCPFFPVKFLTIILDLAGMETTCKQCELVNNLSWPSKDPPDYPGITPETTDTECICFVVVEACRKHGVLFIQKHFWRT